MVAKSRYEEQCCRRFDKDNESKSTEEHVDENVSINMISAKSSQKTLMDAQQKFNAGSPGRQPN